MNECFSYVTHFQRRKSIKLVFYLLTCGWTIEHLAFSSSSHILFSAFFGIQIPIPIKAINCCTYFTTTIAIGREKNRKNHIEFSSVSSNIVSHQKPPSISEDFFFLFKNLRIACWSCVQKSNHRTRKSDFYWKQSSSRLILGVSTVYKSQIDWSVSPITVNWKFRNPLLKCVLLCKKFKSSFVQISKEMIFVEILLLVRRIKGWLFLP